jgi:GntR family transcriptional regulator/MocR family aminotransferase
VYVTPSHQFPLGGILPAGRRAALIRFARENGIYIIEDDYDSEFRYCGEPVAPVYSMDSRQVIYVGTFSKILFPSLRIGYVILPRQLHSKWCHLRTHTDVQNPPFEQAVLAEFLHARKLDRYIQKMRRLYGARRETLLRVLGETFGKGWRSWGDAAGLHLAVEFPGMCFDNEFKENCKRKGILVTPAEYHSIRKGRHIDKLLIGYGHLEPEEIHRGITLLHDLIKS